MTNHQLARLLLAQPEHRVLVREWGEQYGYDVGSVITHPLPTGATVSLLVQQEEPEIEL